MDSHRESHSGWTASVLTFIVVMIAFASVTPDALAEGRWFVSTEGDDGNPCDSSAQACRSVDGVLAKAGFESGDKILVSSGTYVGAGDEVVRLDTGTVISGGWDANFIKQTGVSTFDGERTRRVMTVGTAATVVLDHVHVTRGFVTRSKGGGIYNQGVLRIAVSSLSDNRSEAGDGGGVYNAGTLVVTHSILLGNSAGPPRGSGDGGGIDNAGALTVANSTFFSNRASLGRGGGVNNELRFVPGGPENSLTITNSTFSGNSAFSGGGVSNSGSSAFVSNTTFSANDATLRGGNVEGSLGAMRLRSSIIDVGEPDNCSGSIASEGYNIDSDDTCNLTAIGDRPNSNPMLSPLEDNGGPTPTHALLPGSMAIDGIPLLDCTNDEGKPLYSDQRGVFRPQGRACDIGAFELQIEMIRCDIDGDLDVDRDDVNAIRFARGAVVDPRDPRDADSDGEVTLLDARACMLECTSPRCKKRLSSRELRRDRRLRRARERHQSNVEASSARVRAVDKARSRKATNGRLRRR